jgi:N-acetylmuramoyl-L-alanine amidase
MFDLLPKSCLIFCSFLVIAIPWGVASTQTKAVSNQQISALSPAKSSITAQNQQPLVVIDPGHGGKDSGDVGLEDLRESDVVLPISLQVATILNKQGVTTKLTRSSDTFVGLDERLEISKRAKASMFVSIHANSIDNNPDAQGLETYHYDNTSKPLATAVHGNILKEISATKPLVDRQVRRARFLVLRKSTIPAIVIETGYITNATESTWLANPEYRDRMAVAIANGILKYLGKETVSYNSSSLPRKS